MNDLPTPHGDKLRALVFQSSAQTRLAKFQLCVAGERCEKHRIFRISGQAPTGTARDPLNPATCPKGVPYGDGVPGAARQGR